MDKAEAWIVHAFCLVVIISSYNFFSITYGELEAGINFAFILWHQMILTIIALIKAVRY